MEKLKQKIIERIRRKGPITFEEFMAMALYEPGLGYYTSGETRIGRAGDYYTSSHLHRLFGWMAGRQIEEMWEIMGKPPFFDVVEMGAGQGYLSSDMLGYFKEREIFSSLNYTIIELNPIMMKKQAALLSGFSGKVKWSRSLDELHEVKGCIFSNELLDAFPVHLVRMEDGIKEIYVGADGDDFTEVVNGPSTDRIACYLKEFSLEFDKGFRTEVNIRIKDWLRTIDNVLSEGFVFTIDYGYPSWAYYSEDRNRGTLLCYHEHQATEDPYQNIGEQDITAHVNFSSVKKWGEEMGIRTTGFCQQGVFLMALGIDVAIAEIYRNSPDYIFEVANIKRLLLPGTLGETHKVMIQYKGNGNPELRGFSIKNQIKNL